ncbi:hypothetical protein QOZ80_4AG0314890 [Eleusine coracana subsp. coracana]|nr:hypothetical protein QOZ80_4AG0314890 [Eleusine coracana subsp. coracana]
MKPSLTRSPKTMTQSPAPIHCVLDTTVCWYASSVTAAPTHPIRNPLKFRSMPPPLLASTIASSSCSSPSCLVAVAYARKFSDKGWEMGKGN